MVDSDNQTEKRPPAKPGFGRILQSTLAGAIGVQSNKNREKDFENGNIWVFIVSGIIFTLLFILTIVTVVQFAISAA